MNECLIGQSGGRRFCAAAAALWLLLCAGTTFAALTADAEFCAETFHLPPDRDGKPGVCVFSVAELPKNEPVRFAVRPVDCFGEKGHEIVSEQLGKVVK